MAPIGKSRLPQQRSGGLTARAAQLHKLNKYNSKRTAAIKVGKQFLKIGKKYNKKKKQSLTQKITKRDGPISESKFHWPKTVSSRPLDKNLKKMLAPQIFNQTASARVTAAIGQQGFQTGAMPGLFTIQDMSDIFTKVAELTILAGGGIVVNPNTQKLYFKSCSSELMMTNQTNDPAHVIIYDCVARRDSSSANFVNPGVSWQQGCVDSGSATQYQTVGNNPFAIPLFTEFWKIEKITDVNLHSGGHHVHKTWLDPMHVMDREIQIALGTTGACIGKWTRFSLVVIHGYPLNDSVTQTQISTSAVAVDMVWRKQYEIEVLERSTTQMAQTNTLVTSFAVGGEIIDDLTGLVKSILIA